MSKAINRVVSVFRDGMLFCDDCVKKNCKFRGIVWDCDEKIVADNSEKKCPICLKGERACPPEDIGGVGGYYDYLEALKNKDNDVYEDVLEIFGDEFDPEEFDLDEINQYLSQFQEDLVHK